MVLEYYQKNPSAYQSLKGSLYEEKIMDLIKSKIKINIKELNVKEAEKIISDFNKPNIGNKFSPKLNHLKKSLDQKNSKK